MIFGLLPADSIRVGVAIRVGIWSENRSNADQPAQGSAALKRYAPQNRRQK
jgi:hypothetical protein